MMIPGLAYLLINNYIPLPGLMLAFKKYNYSLGMWKSPFNGVDNFKFLFVSNEVKTVIRNTLLYNLAFIVLGTIVAVMVAVFLSQITNKLFRKITQTIILIPYLISMVIVAYMVFALLSMDRGLLNSIITSLGGQPISWYTEAKYWPIILVLVNLWKGFGYSSVIYYTTILGIDISLYEAASVDGAGKWKQFTHITLPSIRLTIITLVLLSVGKIFYSDFGLFYQVPMNSGPIHSVTSTVDTFVYNALMTMNDIGRSAAAGFMQAICGFVLIFAVNKLVGKIDSESALF
jgi:putative aldouronate transport system permease protein